MMRSRLICSGAVLVGVVVTAFAWPTARPAAQPSPSGGVQIDNADIGGMVTGKNGPEAGVWVVAETSDLGPRFAKIVVTDAHGRSVIPDLPQATYNVSARGSWLVDSPTVTASSGQTVNLTA